jgi:heterodisulfide reductase subunit A
MAVAKSRLQEPLKSETVGVTPAALVIGGGVAGMTSALALADQGFPVHIIEKEQSLGGLAKNLYRSLDGSDVQEFLAAKIAEVKAHPKITVHAGVEVKKTDGFVGNFETTLTTGSTVKHGAIVLATGGVEYQPTEYLAGTSSNVITQRDLEKKLFGENLTQSGERYVMIRRGLREEPAQAAPRLLRGRHQNAIAIKMVWANTMSTANRSSSRWATKSGSRPGTSCWTGKSSSMLTGSCCPSVSVPIPRPTASAPCTR